MIASGGWEGFPWRNVSCTIASRVRCRAEISSMVRAATLTGAFLMLRARFAYLSVFSVSSRLRSWLLQHAITSVLLLPPSESCTATE
jgi:hypothetical protein